MSWPYPRVPGRRRNSRRSSKRHWFRSAWAVTPQVAIRGCFRCGTATKGLSSVPPVGPPTLCFLREDDRVSFEVSRNTPPYMGVRGHGTATIEPDTVSTWDFSRRMRDAAETPAARAPEPDSPLKRPIGTTVSPTVSTPVTTDRSSVCRVALARVVPAFAPWQGAVEPV